MAVARVNEERSHLGPAIGHSCRCGGRLFFFLSFLFKGHLLTCIIPVPFSDS
jgi:hypothetical protein